MPGTTVAIVVALGAGMTVLLVYIAHRSWVSRRQSSQTEVAPGLVEQE